ncbi:MAG: Fic family protein [Verrucomicrobiota bacterium]
MKYNWQQSDWPCFRYDLETIDADLFTFSEKTGRLGGLLEALPEELQTESMVDMMVSEAIETSLIEGEYLRREDVMSSVRKNLGLAKDEKQVGDLRAKGIAELMVVARNEFAEPLSEEMLFDWHEKLMQGFLRIKEGAWRSHDESMLVVSGSMGNEKIHFEAPSSTRVPEEMGRFIDWFNDTAPGGKTEIRSAPVRSAVAHLYFESIHPFEDGNGRIGRTLAEKALSQGIGRPVHFSLSQAIDADRQAYYAALKEGQRSNEITGWIDYFVNTALLAQENAEARIGFTLKKTKLFDRVGSELNDRQLKVVRRMLEEGAKGFEGGMSAKKYIAIAGTSKPTATRDLQDLVAKKVFIQTGGGRSTRYDLNL